jgi:hypothetical protein
VEDKALAPKRSKNSATKSAPSALRKKTSTAAKEEPENLSRTGNKSAESVDVEEDDAHENLQDKYYMHKYTARDLKTGGKGDLEGLVPYTVAQILCIKVKEEKNASGAHLARGIQLKKGKHCVAVPSCLAEIGMVCLVK